MIPRVGLAATLNLTPNATVQPPTADHTAYIGRFDLSRQHLGWSRLMSRADPEYQTSLYPSPDHRSSPAILPCSSQSRE